MTLNLFNLSCCDRVLRFGSGAVLMVMGWTTQQGDLFVYSSAATWFVSLRVFALYPLITGVVGWCPLKTLIHRKTPSKNN